MAMERWYDGDGAMDGTMAMERWYDGDGAMDYRFIAIVLSLHRHRTIAPSRLQVDTRYAILHAPSYHRSIAPSPSC